MKMSITTYLEDIINDPEINQWKKLYTSLDLKEIKDIIPDIKEITTEKKETKEIGIENIIYEKENVCLIGEAGCGKTTSLRYLTLMLAQKEDEDAIPLYVDLTNFTSAYTDFEEFIEYILKSRSFPIDTAKELLVKGHFVILVDSLDALLIERIDLIGKFMIKFSNSRFIFSSREGGYYERLNIKKKWDVLPLDDEKKKACVERYVGKEEADEFFDEIERSPQKDVLEALISNPLMLWMTVKIFADNRKLPENRTKIYHKYIRYFYEHNKKRNVEIKQERHIIEKALSEIAFVMHCNNIFSIDEESVYDSLKDVKNDCINLNFVSVIESEIANFVKFVPHPSFQEYFCAVYLKELYKDAIGISVTFTHPRWENVFVFLSGMLEDSSALVKDIMRYDLSLAAKCIESGKVDQSVITDAIKKLQVLAGSNFSYDRTRAVGSLGRIGSDESVGILIKCLGNSHVQWSAADALVKIGSESAVDGLLHCFSNEDSDVRRRAADALGKIRSESAVAALLLRLSDEDSDVRRRAADALVKIKSESAVDGLLYCFSNEDSDVRRRAADALVKIKSERAVDGLLLRLSDEDRYVRRRAADALGEIRSERAVDGLLLHLSDEDGFVRRRAADALGKIKSEKAVDGLLLRLSDVDGEVRRRAADALGKIKSERVVDGLLLRLSDEDSDIRGRAADALGGIKSERVVDGLLLRLSDEDGFVRRRAADALGKIKSERAVDGLLLRVSDEDTDIRGRAADALGEIKSERAVDGLLLRLSAKDRYVRRRAADALGEIRSERAVDGLLLRLSDEDRYVRRRAADALVKIRSERAVDGLLLRLSDKDRYVRRRAADALGEIRSERAVDGLLHCLFDENVRLRAAKALVKIGSERAVDGLLLRLSAKDRYVRGKAADALGEIRSERAVDGLLLRLSDEDRYVRGRAADALVKIRSERAVDGLLLRLSDEDRYVRLRAADALGEIRSERAVDGLLLRLSDEDRYVRLRAADALDEIRSERAVDGLLLRLSDESRDVRRRAADALVKIRSERAVDGLLQYLSDNEFEFAVQYAADALASCGKEKDIYKLENYLSDAKGYDIAYEAIQQIKLRETQEIKLKVTKRVIQKKEDAEKIKDFTTELNQKEFTSISLNDLSCSEETKDYRSIKLYCKYLNPLYPCIVQYFIVKNLYSIQITVKNVSDSDITDVKVSYIIGGLMKDYETMTIADNLKKGVQESKGFIIDPKSLFGNEASKTSLIITISFKDKEKQESEFQMPLTIASKNSILLSEKEKNWHELIAAFVTPNDHEIIAFIKKLDCEVVGYQLGEKEVLKQVKRIYEKLTEVDFKYVSISKDLVGLQSVQMPYETLSPAGGNCIDGVLLFSSICEKSNIHPAIVFVPGHALFAFKTSPYGNDYYVLETTDISKKSFEDAVRDGFNCYREEMKNNPENVFAIDVEKARKDGVMPLEKTWK